MGRDGRAQTPQEKRAFLDNLLIAWLEVPDMRLGQLLINVAGNGDDLWGLEEGELLVAVEGFCEKNRGLYKQSREEAL